MAKTYEAIATTTLASAANTYTFTSIPATYTDLVCVVNGSMSSADYVQFQLGNGSIDTGTNYSNTALVGTGSTAYSSRGTTRDSIFSPEPFTTSQCNWVIQFNNYSNTTIYKSSLFRSNVPVTGGGATFNVNAATGLWRSTSAIERIKFSSYYGFNYTAGTTFTLYGIKAA